MRHIFSTAARYQMTCGPALVPGPGFGSGVIVIYYNFTWNVCKESNGKYIYIHIGF